MAAMYNRISEPSTNRVANAELVLYQFRAFFIEPGMKKQRKKFCSSSAFFLSTSTATSQQFSPSNAMTRNGKNSRGKNICGRNMNKEKFRAFNQSLCRSTPALRAFPWRLYTLSLIYLLYTPSIRMKP